MSDDCAEYTDEVLRHVQQGGTLPDRFPQHDIDGTFGFPRKDHDSERFEVAPGRVHHDGLVEVSMSDGHLNIVSPVTDYRRPFPKGGWWGSFVRSLESRWQSRLWDAKHRSNKIEPEVESDEESETSEEDDEENDAEEDLEDNARDEGQSGLGAFA